MDDNLLTIENLTVHYEMDTSVVEAVNNVTLSIHKGETLGLVGETGAGKTTAALSILGLVQKPRGHIIGGKIILNGEDLLKKSEKQMKKIRGGKISMVFQDPMTSLNPVMKVGDQIAEVIRLHDKLSRKDAMLRAMELLNTVGIPDYRASEYPHQFSGGMKQRVVIAIAMACKPELLIADEPTTALDVTIQAQVLELMKEQIKGNDMAVLMITHDLGVVAEICDKCAVMYAGEIVEYGTVENILDEPVHPYTQNLLNALPSLDKDIKRLKPIKGAMSDPTNLPSYCSFYDRCERREAACMEANPILTEVSRGHFSKCFCSERISG
jgi:peptide/nickel transport system ATP-binding protein